MTALPGELLRATRFAAGLRRFLATPTDSGAARRELTARLAQRDRAFLDVMGRTVFDRSESPYRPLMAHAGIELGDLSALVEQQGVEGALRELHGAGVRVSLDEFRCRRPIRRGSLELAPEPADFDNPLFSRTWTARTGGSRSQGRRVLVDLDLLACEAGYHALFLEAFGVQGRPYAVWRPAPPGAAGLKNVLWQAKLGRPVERWFSQHAARTGLDGFVPAMTPFALRAARALGSPLPVPEHVPLDQAGIVARWLAAKVSEGRPAVLDTNASSAVRVGAAAAELGLNVAGSMFRMGGEPYTEAKARVLAAAGVRGACHYSMGEASRIGLACSAPQALDDVHLLVDKLALLQPHPEGQLLLSTLLPVSPKLLLNVEVDDCAVVEERECGCPLGELGLTTHLRQIRSQEKLTSEGMSFLGADLMTLVEDALPARFGGTAGDFQLVEHEDGGLPVVELLVAPELGPLAKGDVVTAVMSYLGGGDPGRRMMAARWQAAGTLRIVRRRPIATPAGKVLPVHVLR
jgi:hypothetical protein